MEVFSAFFLFNNVACKFKPTAKCILRCHFSLGITLLPYVGDSWGCTFGSSNLATSGRKLSEFMHKCCNLRGGTSHVPFLGVLISETTTTASLLENTVGNHVNVSLMGALAVNADHPASPKR